MMWTHMLSCGVPGGGCEALVWTVKHVGDSGTTRRIRGLGAIDKIDPTWLCGRNVIKAHQ